MNLGMHRIVLSMKCDRLKIVDDENKSEWLFGYGHQEQILGDAFGEAVVMNDSAVSVMRSAEALHLGRPGVVIKDDRCLEDGEMEHKVRER